MKYFLSVLFMALFSMSCMEQPKIEDKEPAVDPQVETIKNVVLTSYVDGLQNEGDSLKIDQGFHPAFEMLGRNAQDSLFKRPIAPWRNQQVKRREAGELPNEGAELVRGEFEFVDVTDDVAVAKLIYYKGNRHAYTDYISLYKMNGEWKIVSKVYTTID